MSITPRWIEAFIEMGMAWYTGFALVWVLTIISAYLSLRFYRPFLVIPNIVVLFIGILFNGFAFGKNYK